MHGIKGLTRRRTGIYAYRRVFSKELAKYLGIATYDHSFLTRDRAEAVQRAVEEERKVDAMVAEARATMREARRQRKLAKLPESESAP